jgi:aryl-alcohol dehydrogenase-like predicted oxidoreductase
MQYRRLGRSGLKVSELSLGSWITYHTQVDVVPRLTPEVVARIDEISAPLAT